METLESKLCMSYPKSLLCLYFVYNQSVATKFGNLPWIHSALTIGHTNHVLPHRVSQCCLSWVFLGPGSRGSLVALTWSSLQLLVVLQGLITFLSFFYCPSMYWHFFLTLWENSLLIVQGHQGRTADSEGLFPGLQMAVFPCCVLTWQRDWPWRAWPILWWSPVRWVYLMSPCDEIPAMHFGQKTTKWYVPLSASRLEVQCPLTGEVLDHFVTFGAHMYIHTPLSW